MTAGVRLKSLGDEWSFGRDSLAKGQIVPFFILNLDQNNNIFWKCIFEYVKVKEALELREAKIENGSRVPGPDRADREHGPSQESGLS